MMRSRFYTLILVTIGFVALTWEASQAAGSYQKKPMFVASFPAPSLPKLSAGQILGGCGGKRYRDPQTHQCRGPADIGN